MAAAAASAAPGDLRLGDGGDRQRANRQTENAPFQHAVDPIGEGAEAKRAIEARKRPLRDRPSPPCDSGRPHMKFQQEEHDGHEERQDTDRTRADYELFFAALRAAL
jgi:hypothetical protein